MTLEKLLQKDLQDLEKMSMVEILEKNQDKEVNLEVVIHQNVLDHILRFALEVDPELDYKDHGREIVDLILNLFPDEDLFLVEGVNHLKEDQLLEEDLLRENDPFLEEDQDLFLENEDLYREEDPGDQSRDLDKEDLYHDLEDHYLDLAIDVKIRKSTNLEVDRETEKNLDRNHLESLRNPEKENIQREKHKVDQDQKEDLVPEIGNKLIKL